MLKFLLLELVKAYVRKITTPKQPEKQYSHCFIAFFSIIALFLLIGADYIYLYDVTNYLPYVATLLKISTILFLLSVLIKLISVWLCKSEKKREIAETGSLPQVVFDCLPTIVSMIPVGIIAYVLWAKIQVKVLGKNTCLKDSLNRLIK